MPGRDLPWYTDQPCYQARYFSCNQLLWLYASTSWETKTIHKTGLRNSSGSIYFKLYLWSFADYHHLKNDIYNWIIILTYCIICKSISGVNYLEMSLVPSNAHILNATISSVLKNCKWLKKLCVYIANNHVLQSLFLVAKCNFLPVF